MLDVRTYENLGLGEKIKSKKIFYKFLDELKLLLPPEVLLGVG